MAIAVSRLKRKIIYNNVELPDIENLTPNQIIKHYSGVYPELTTGSINFKEIKDDTEIYEISLTAGIKG